MVELTIKDFSIGTISEVEPRIDFLPLSKIKIDKNWRIIIPDNMPIERLLIAAHDIEAVLRAFDGFVIPYLLSVKEEMNGKLSTVSFSSEIAERFLTPNTYGLLLQYATPLSIPVTIHTLIQVQATLHAYATGEYIPKAKELFNYIIDYAVANGHKDILHSLFSVLLYEYPKILQIYPVLKKLFAVNEITSPSILWHMLLSGKNVEDIKRQMIEEDMLLRKPDGILLNYEIWQLISIWSTAQWDVIAKAATDLNFVKRLYETILYIPQFSLAGGENIEIYTNIPTFLILKAWSQHTLIEPVRTVMNNISQVLNNNPHILPEIYQHLIAWDLKHPNQCSPISAQAFIFLFPLSTSKNFINHEAATAALPFSIIMSQPTPEEFNEIKFMVTEHLRKTFVILEKLNLRGTVRISDITKRLGITY